jgi:hypothetical protein
MLNLQNQPRDFGFQVGDLYTEINGNIIGIKYTLGRDQTWWGDGTMVSQL